MTRPEGFELTDMDALPACPVEAVQQWLDEAAAFTSRPNPNAVVLATVGDDGQPSARMMLLKSLDERGAVIYTNLHSLKSRQITANPKVALLLHWDVLGRQVRIEGSAIPVSDEEADAYFASRAWASKIGALASDQSNLLESREQLARRVVETTTRYPIGSEVPRPPHWSGYRISLDRVELWQEGDDRLHDRIVYTPSEVGGSWTRRRLWP